MSKRASVLRLREGKKFAKSYIKSVIKNNNFTKDEKINHNTCVFSERQKDGWLYCYLFKEYLEDSLGYFIDRACEFYVSKEEIKKTIVANVKAAIFAREMK